MTFTSIAAGQDTSVALSSTGAVYDWGYNYEGELGNGTNTPSSTPVAASLPAGTTVTGISEGDAYTMAVTSSGDVYDWGFNFNGELGDGTTTYSNLPIKVPLPSGVTATAVAAGTLHSLALTTTGAIYAWGYNGDGELGNGTTTRSLVPTLVSLPAGVTVTAIAAGGEQSLALTSTGAIYAWGQNTYGDLGDGSTSNSELPVLVSLPAGVTATAVAGTPDDSLAVTSTGAVYAWGLNALGQLGNGTTTDSDTPVLVNLPTGVVATSVAAGNSDALALTSTGSIYAWGWNIAGELGNGTNTDSSAPVAVSLPQGVTATAIAAGSQHDLALTVTDDDLAIVGVPASITVKATSPSGATVTYATPTATDEETPPTVVCDHVSGSTFLSGVTTVTCTATDNDDANSPLSASFTVTVQGALVQLQALAVSVQGVGPGTSFFDTVQTAISAYQAKNFVAACSDLSTFVSEVKAQSGKKLTVAQALTLISTAQQIESVIGC